ncbi:MAG: ABC transporter permease subunit [Pseudomonadota bacterium]
MALSQAIEPRTRSFDVSVLPWLVVALLGAATFLLRGDVKWLAKYPKAFNKEVIAYINIAMEWFVDTFGWLFGAISWLLEWPMVVLQGVLQWLPWSATLAGFTVLAFVAGGRRLAIFTACALFYMVITGYWPESMNTLALVGVSVPLAVALGFGLGVWGYRSDRAEKVIQPCLDLMQTVPTFAYLIPILLLFGFGPVVGLIASAIYACPPMVRNTMHGLRRIPPDILESGKMCGTTKRQRFWWVEVPTALPQIMVGVNQTTMAALSMVIIAAIIGGFDDIGWEVLSTMRKAQFGQSLLSGLVIALIAMIMDRISWGFTRRDQFLHTGEETLWQRHGMLFTALGAMIVLTVISQVATFLDSYPRDWRFYPADPINQGLSYVVSTFGGFFDGIKNGVNFYFLLPIKIGLIKAVRPVSWGIEFTPLLKSLYWVLIAGLVAWSYRGWTWRGAVTVLIIGTFLYFGLTNTPWPLFFAVVALVAWQAGGWRVTAFAVASMLFILLTGVWKQAMLSVYLCGAAVLFSFVVGGAMGVWAAGNDRVSAILRPINDTLQTMPQFVYLIPILFLFQIGDFSALIAVIAYAIVPMIRYTEHGVRNVRPDVLEAATSMGCTKRQILFQIQLPMALPEIMLGLNQTIMYGLAMLVIAALVGTRDLGQLVYIALGKANAGQGLVAGLSIALIAMVADRIIQAWANKKKAQLGLE